MRKEYDFKTLPVKRRGPLPGLQGRQPCEAKVRVTVTLEEDVVNWFKTVVSQSEILPYQTLVNQILRQTIQQTQGLTAEAETLKRLLLQDSEFL